MRTIIIFLFGIFMINVLCAQLIGVGDPNVFPKGQEESNWCWAACVEIVLEYGGINITQSQIVSRVFGDTRNEEASQREIMAALSGWGFDRRGIPRKIYCRQVTGAESEVISALSRGWPLIVGIRNRNGTGYHAVVLSHLEYIIVNGQYSIQTVTIKDPLYQGKGTFRLSWKEFLSIHGRNGMFLNIWTEQI